MWHCYPFIHLLFLHYKYTHRLSAFDTEPMQDCCQHNFIFHSDKYEGLYTHLAPHSTHLSHGTTHSKLHAEMSVGSSGGTNRVFSGVAVFLRMGVHEAVTLVAPAVLASQLGLPLIGQLGEEKLFIHQEPRHFEDITIQTYTLFLEPQEKKNKK